jgi:hypothetical protein
MHRENHSEVGAVSGSTFNICLPRFFFGPHSAIYAPQRSDTARAIVAELWRSLLEHSEYVDYVHTSLVRLTQGIR